MPASTPTVIEVALAQSTEEAVQLPSGVARLAVQARQAVDITVAFVSDGPRWTVKSGTRWEAWDLATGPLTLYLETADAAGATVEVLYWV